MLTEKQDTLLKRVYYNPKGGFGSVARLWQAVKDSELNLKLADVKEWHDAQNIAQVYKETKRTAGISNMHARGIGQIKADLIDMSNYGKWNKGNNWILTMIDLYSRRAWAFSVHRKSPKDIAPFIREVYDELMSLKHVDSHNITFTADDGNEWKGEVKAYFNKHEIPVYVANPNNNTKHRTSTVERFNRSLLNYLTKVMAYRESNKYIDILDEVIDGYNENVHSTTKLKPIDVYDGKANYDVGEVENDIKIPIGAHVRIQTKQAIFDKKARVKKYSSDIYVVVGRVGYRYQVARLTDLKPIDGLYLQQQLLIVKNVQNHENNDLGANEKEIITEKRDKKLRQQNKRDAIDEINIIDAPRVRRAPAKLRD